MMRLFVFLPFLSSLVVAFNPASSFSFSPSSSSLFQHSTKIPHNVPSQPLSSFLSPSTIRRKPADIKTPTQLYATGFEGLNAAIKARENCPPQICLENLLITTIRDMNVDPLIIKFGHPAMMALMLSSMLSFGAYLGYQVRKDRLAKQVLASENGGNMEVEVSEDNDANSDFISYAKKNHPLLMGGVAIFSFLGAQGGVMSELVQGKSLADSWHFISAGAVLAALLVQYATSTNMSKENVRNIHALFGGGVVLMVLTHGIFGLQLAMTQ